MSVGLAQYNPNVAFSGFGVDSAQNVYDLEKSLVAGYQVTNQTGGSALRVESLEGSLKTTSYTAHHIKFWKKLPKSPAYSTVEEFNQLTSYGSDALAFVGEGELPPTQDASYARKTAFIKFIGVTLEVSHVMTAVHPAHGDVIAQTNQNGILWLLNKMEDSFFHGDSTLAFDGQAEQWDGLDSLIDPTSYIDLEGQPFQEADIEAGANQIVEQYGYPTDLWLGTRASSDLVKQFYPRERVQLPAPVNGMVGLSINSVMTQAGVMELNPDVFIKNNPSPPSATTSANAPGAPSIAIAQVAATTGDFTKGASTGTNEYNYVVTAANRFGESAPSAIPVANVAITQAEKDAGEKITVTITNPNPIGTFPPEYFRIYRTNPIASGGAVPTLMSSFSLVGQIPASSQTAGGTTVFSDLNFLLPFTSIAYMGEMTPSVITFRQLLPMMRMDLALIAPSYRWMVLLYGAQILFASRKWLRYINIGKLV